MNKFFLQRLFKYSKTGFGFVMVFVICYAVFFYKKMDSTFFPYNSMFAIDFNKTYTASAYAVKINGEVIGITHNLYWKKDFLEESLSNYAKYKTDHDSLYINGYIDSRINDNKIKGFLSSRLMPAKKDMDQWLAWYTRFANYSIPLHATIELFKYDFVFENNAAILKDSTSIYKTSLVNAE